MLDETCAKTDRQVRDYVLMQNYFHLMVPGEIRDRFGPVPDGVELMLQVAELKRRAAARNITAIEVEEEKLKLTRHGDLLLIGGKFPPLTKREPAARLKAIRRLLLAL